MGINFSAYRAGDIDAKLRRAGFRPLDVMVAGVTGAGKSTTLNALFQKTVATVGDGVDPETMEIAPYKLNDVFRVWDTPGLGDRVQADEIHKRKMVDLLHKTYTYDNVFYGFIDLALVIIDGSNRDMGTTYTLLNEVVVPNIQRNRILVVINQADIAMKGRHWDYALNAPDSTLVSYLEDKALSIQGRVQEATGVTILKPVYYSAKHGYHMREVFDFIIKNMPSQRRHL